MGIEEPRDVHESDFGMDTVGDVLVKPWLSLIRPQDFIIAFLGALACSMAVNAPMYPDAILIGFIAGFGILTANTYNDFVDRELDGKSIGTKRERPLASGKLSEMDGMLAINSLIIMSFVFIISFVVVTNDVITGVVAFDYLMLVLWYSYRAKPKWGIGGHIVAAISGTGIMVVPSVHMHNGSLLPMIVALFFLEVGREIVTGCSDHDAEVKMGYKTVPAIYGWRTALKISLPFTFIFCFVFPVETMFNQHLSSLYLIGGTALGMGCILCPLTYMFNPELHVFNWKWGQVCMKVPLILFSVLLLADIMFV